VIEGDPPGRAAVARVAWPVLGPEFQVTVAAPMLTLPLKKVTVPVMAAPPPLPGVTVAVNVTVLW